MHRGVTELAEVATVGLLGADALFDADRAVRS
jgi:hypothetical protein